MSKTQAKARDAAVFHTNLYLFAAVVQLLEGPTSPRVSRSAKRAADQIIRICKRQEQRELKNFDAALAKVTKN